MDFKEAMQSRHSVRAYSDRAIEPEKISRLQEKIRECNASGGLHIQLVCNEPKAFDGFMAHYGKFSGVTNYIAMIGRKADDLQEKCGYYGEQLVLLAQTMGLNTCWVAMTYSKIKSAYQIDAGEKLVIVIALGYGSTQGVAHKSRTADKVSRTDGEAADWFANGIEAARLAPTAMNQQKFRFTKSGNKVAAEAGTGFYSKIDLGIAKLHFELGAGTENFVWA